MTASLGAPYETSRVESTQQLTDWLAGVAERRDLSLAAPADEGATCIGALLDALSEEFSDYRDVVDQRRDFS